jgi:5'-nucleotidase
MYRRGFLGILFALLTTGCASRPKAPTSGPRCVEVLGSADMHGALSHRTRHAGDVEIRYGGLPTQNAYIKALREKYPEQILLLDGGDIYQGSLASNLNYGQALIAAMNHMGYAAAAVGNHEFDFGPGPDAGDDRLAIMKKRFVEAKFPFLAANIINKNTDKPVQWPNHRASVLLEVNGIQIGIIGAATPETTLTTNPENIVDLEFPPAAPYVIAQAKKLRHAGAQLIILLAHIGARCRSLKDPFDASSCQPDSHLIELVKALPQGTIHAALGGHTHNFIGHWIDGAALMQAGSNARALSHVSLCVDEQNNFDWTQSSIHPPINLCLDEWAEGGCRYRKKSLGKMAAKFDGQPLPKDLTFEKLLAPYLEAVVEKEKEHLGITLPYAYKRKSQEHNLGDALCAGMRQISGADIGIHNLGGVRTDLPAGDLNFGQAFKVLPFENFVAVAHLTGEEIHTFVATLLKRRQGDRPFVSGLIVDAQSAEDFSLRLENGAALGPTQHYIVATSDFMSKGGEGLGSLFKSLQKKELKSLELSVRDALIAYFKKVHPSP